MHIHKDIQTATEEDPKLQMLERYIIRGWLLTKDKIEPEVEKYWPIRHELAMIDCVEIKGKSIIIPCLLQKQTLKQLHSNHMGTEKRWLLARESVYWINMNANIGQTVKQCSTCLKYQHTQLHEAALHHDIPYKPNEVVSANIFMVNNNNLLCIVDYYSKLVGLSAHDLVQVTEIIFAEFRQVRKIVSDAGEKGLVSWQMNWKVKGTSAMTVINMKTAECN